MSNRRSTWPPSGTTSAKCSQRLEVAVRSASSRTSRIEESMNCVSRRSTTSEVPVAKIAASRSPNSSAVERSCSPFNVTSQRPPDRSLTTISPERYESADYNLPTRPTGREEAASRQRGTGLNPNDTKPTTWRGASLCRRKYRGIGLVGPIPRIGAPRFELGTSPTRTVRATRLRHAPRQRRIIAQVRPATRRHHAWRSRRRTPSTCAASGPEPRPRCRTTAGRARRS